jgi:hypothetical protein
MRKSLILGAVAAAALTFGSAAFADSDGFSDRDRQKVYRHQARPSVVYAYPESYEQTGSVYVPGGYYMRRDSRVYEDRFYDGYRSPGYDGGY